MLFSIFSNLVGIFPFPTSQTRVKKPLQAGWRRKSARALYIRKINLIITIIASSPLQYAFRGLCFRTADCSCSLANARRAVTGAAS
jgi:hypothetical protein